MNSMIKQKIGTGLLIVALVLTWMMETGLAYLVLLAVGILDLYLELHKEKTISQWVQALWPKIIDYPVLAGLSVFTFIMFFKQFGFLVGMQAMLPLFIFFILLHLFANKT